MITNLVKAWRASWPILGMGAFLGLIAGAPAQSAYLQHNLVSDLPGLAGNTDTNLLNPWGIAFSAGGPFWISDNHSGYSTVYNSTGAVQSLVVMIPPPAGGTPPAAPSGIVFNSTTNFLITNNAAKFIFSAEDGTISAWASGTNAVLEVDNSSSGTVYKGLALGSASGSNYLYATDFHNGKVDVFDRAFAPVVWPGAFSDPAIPAGFAPFGIEPLGTNLVVAYAKQDAEAMDDVAGAGYGFVDLYDTYGNLIKRLISNGVLNSPWGMTVAPANFGLFSGQLLVGNFGDGTINAFDPVSGTLVGTLKDTNGSPIAVEGLWDLKFGNGGNAGTTNTLYFTAGIAGGGSLEDHGLFGSLSLVAPQYTPTNATIIVGPGGARIFSPSVTTVNAGDQIIWNWGSTFHSTTSGANDTADGLWNSTVITQTPHTFTNSISTPGTYPFYCQPHYSFGMTGQVTVAAVKFPPASLLYSPGGGTVYAAPANVTLRATAAGNSAPVTNVQFQVGTTVLTNLAAAPYSAVASNLPAGSYTLSAIATDNNGLLATNSVNVTVVTPVTTTLSGTAAPARSQFQLSYLVNTGLTYVVQLSTNLAAGNWVSIATNMATTNPVVFVDPHATNSPAFYRVGRQPNP